MTADQDWLVWGMPVEVSEPFGGSCPVQAFGTIGPRSWYFRARGQHWSVAIGDADTDTGGLGGYVDGDGADLCVVGPSDDVAPYSAGYMEDHESERHLAFALELFARGIRGFVQIPDPANMLPPCIRCGATTADQWRSIACCAACAPKGA